MAAPRKGFPIALKALYDWLDAKKNPVTPEEVAGLVITDHGSGPYRKTVFTFTDVEMALTDVASTVAYAGLQIGTFPEGAVHHFGSHADLVIGKDAAGVNDDWEGDFGLGTVTASNNGTLASTEQNLIPTTATPEADETTTAQGVSTSTEAAKVLDGTTTPVPIFLNILVDDGDQDVTGTPTNLIVNGTVTIHWLDLGDK